MAEEKRERWTGGGKFDDSSHRRSKGRNGGAVECYNCGGLRHTARVCPSVCYTYGCGDHLARDCPRRTRRTFTSHRFEYSSRQKKIGQSMAHIHIPPDLCREILILLPPGSLIRFRSVSKAWRSIIDDPSFVKAHTQKQQPSILLRNSSGLYTFDLETLIPIANVSQQKIPASTLNLAPSALPRLPVATCNGLMLNPLDDEDYRQETTWEIWNTLTQERLELPPPPQNSPDDDWCLHLVGLGYDRSSDDYKAVEIVVHESVLRPHVYSLKSDTWTTKSDFPHSMWNEEPFGQAAFLCGALHWISTGGGEHIDIHMFSFHVGTETLRKFKSPPGLRFSNCQYFMERQLRVDVLDGCLVVSDYGHDDDGLKQHFDIWVMKEYGVVDSWTLLYKLPAFYSRPSSLYCLRPVACMNKDKRQILMQDGRTFYLFDVENNSSKKVDIQGFSGGPVTAQVFHGSIFRLHDNCGVTSGRRRRRRRTWENNKSNMNIVDTQLLFLVTNFRFVGPTRY